MSITYICSQAFHISDTSYENVSENMDVNSEDVIEEFISDGEGASSIGLGSEELFSDSEQEAAEQDSTEQDHIREQVTVELDDFFGNSNDSLLMHSGEDLHNGTIINEPAEDKIELVKEIEAKAEPYDTWKCSHCFKLNNMLHCSVCSSEMSSGTRYNIQIHVLCNNKFDFIDGKIK